MNIRDSDQLWAIAEFDRLWESGESKRMPHRMRELLALIEPVDDGSNEQSLKGSDNAICKT